MICIPNNFDNTPPKLHEGNQPTSKEHIEPEEEKIPGGGKLQISRSTYTDEEKQKYLKRDDYNRLVTIEQEYNDGIMQTDSTRYNEMKIFKIKDYYQRFGRPF